MVLAVNGLPVATIELKNAGTGQSWRHAVRQYQADRDPRAPLFDFKKRALVHFAADPDEVHMTTRLARDKTYFLPFNRGSHPGQVQCGAGNPQHPSGYRTGLFLGRDAATRQLPRHPRALFVHRKEGTKGRRWARWQEAGYERKDGVPALSPTGCGAQAGCQAARRRGRTQLSDSAFGWQWQDQQHFVAFASAGEFAQCAGSEGIRLRCCDHRPAGCWTGSCRMRFTRSNMRRVW